MFGSTGVTTWRKRGLCLMAALSLLLLAWGLDAPHGLGGVPPVPVLPADSEALSIRVLDIGQGDAILIQSPGGKHVLIDAGPGVSKELLTLQLERLSIPQLDLVVATHPHEDHIGGMPMVLTTYPVRYFTDPGTLHNTPPYKDMMEALIARKIPYRVARLSQSFKLDSGIQLDVLAPRDPLFEGTRSDLNNNSVVIRLVWKEFSMLFTGDAEAESEERQVDDKFLAPVDVLKVGHHGSFSSSNPEYIRTIRPKVAIASLGAGNDYGHPHDKTVRTFRERGIDFHRTDEEGQVRVLTDGTWMWVQSFPRKRLEDRSVPLTPGMTWGPTRVDTVVEEKRVASLAAVEPEEPSAPYVASKKSRLFHLSSCDNARKLLPQNRLYFESRAEAVQEGREPAQDCKP